MSGETHRSTPAFAVGGVSYIPPKGQEAFITLPTTGFWECFYCGQRCYTIQQAIAHFGMPQNPAPPAICQDPKFPPQSPAPGPGTADAPADRPSPARDATG